MQVDVSVRRSDVCRLGMAWLGLLALFFSPSVISTSAQSTGGRIRGTVTDPSGGAVTGAKLQLTNEANGTQRETESGASGEYIFLEVPVGTYQIEVTQKGFKKYLRKGLVVNLNEVLSLDTPLLVGRFDRDRGGHRSAATGGYDVHPIGSSGERARGKSIAACATRRVSVAAAPTGSAVAGGTRYGVRQRPCGRGKRETAAAAATIISR